VRLSTATEERLRAHLALAHGDESASRPGVPPVPSDVIFRALQYAHYIMKRIPDDSTRTFKSRSPWPAFTLSDHEREEAYRQLEWMILKGLESENILRTPAPVSPQEIATMDDVFTVFRQCCVGKQIGRDWSILNLLAIGITPAGVGKRCQPRTSTRNVNERALMQTQSIAHKLRKLMP
jgi:hypothetical protein